VGIEEQPKDRNNTDKRIGHFEKKKKILGCSLIPLSAKV
jgi:hypothetical protein